MAEPKSKTQVSRAGEPTTTAISWSIPARVDVIAIRDLRAASNSFGIIIRIQTLMLDWFSQARMSAEQRDDARLPPCPGQILRDYCFFKPDGRLLFLSTLRSRFILTLLPYARDPAQSCLPALFTDKFFGVRPEQTRVLVVTRPEYLPTVVALGGNLLIVADETGDVMIELKAIDSPKVYLIGPRREVIAVLEDPDFGGQLSSTGLRPAA